MLKAIFDMVKSHKLYFLYCFKK